MAPFATSSRVDPARAVHPVGSATDDVCRSLLSNHQLRPPGLSHLATHCCTAADTRLSLAARVSGDVDSGATAAAAAATIAATAAAAAAAGSAAAAAARSAVVTDSRDVAQLA